MRSIDQLVGIFWKRRGADATIAAAFSDAPFEAPPRLGELLAALSIPDFAGLPLEFWPGYRQHAISDHETDAVETLSLSLSTVRTGTRPQPLGSIARKRRHSWFQRRCRLPSF